jgi:hypothetical protein
MCRRLKILPFLTLTRIPLQIAVNLLAKRVGDLSQYIREHGQDSGDSRYEWGRPAEYQKHSSGPRIRSRGDPIGVPHSKSGGIPLIKIIIPSARLSRTAKLEAM